MSKNPSFTSDDLEFALEQAAEFLDMEEWPGDDPEAQKAANQEAARRIRAMVKRLVAQRMKHTVTRR